MEWIQTVDIMILTGLRNVFSTPCLDKPMILISSLGNNGFLWIALAILFFFVGNRKNPWRTWGILLVLCLGANALVCNVLLKPMVARVRPYDLLGLDILVSPLSDFSFPSGHTSASFAAAAAIYSMNKKWGWVAFLFAVLMGFSRIYLGLHYPSDVFGGAVLGWVVAKNVICVFERCVLKNKSRIL
ncbi:undecaprenyl-diphosphatase BcrC [Anaerotignum neopropionicum]|uniref:Undecaprenyl-diphosphatase BcrC n=1 Tax=Anaerotignum neopropionicum TaxID=36847 RepID=A0A136WHJ7_9FIRM|nr:phosphatase PAP2 family protein [Anaerotignum neopropionicum]KXL53924.1 undecaprenyl-diphosphatase BcrC [Anaerotignum neopropionicum]